MKHPGHSRETSSSQFTSFPTVPPQPAGRAIKFFQNGNVELSNDNFSEVIQGVRWKVRAWRRVWLFDDPKNSKFNAVAGPGIEVMGPLLSLSKLTGTAVR